MHRTMRSAPMLSPGTAKTLVAQFASAADLDTASSSSDSPDSLYSNGSPTFADHAFEFDQDIPEVEVEIEERDEDDYESIMGSSAGRDGWTSAAWGRWPEAALDTEPGWSPSPKSKSPSSTRKNSIISLSPRGSFSASVGRRGSTPHSRLRSEERRDSDPSLLGFDLAQRRRSSVRSIGSLYNSSRRRSSAFSNGSLMDPAEDARLRNIASMELLRRRFSEVVEVTCASDDEDDDSQASYGSRDDLAVARAALSQRSFSPYSDSEDSEIHTAPYFPTPELPPRQRALLSNYPLASAVQEEVVLNTPSDFSAQPSPVIPSRLFRPASTNSLISTPPPPAQPIDIIRGRQRPSFPRAMTDYAFPPRSNGVPLGAAPPRPLLGRSVSTPFFSTPQKTQEKSTTLEKRVAGSFPLARSKPLGVSPLRASLRRQSVVSDGAESRRQSVIADGRRASADGRRASIVTDRRLSVESSRRPSEADRRLSLESGRRPSVVERRMSAVEFGNGRRSSTDLRRLSAAKSAASRKSSKSSVASISALAHGRGSLSDSRRGSSHDGRRSSLASRKSSVVSIGEYGYLAPQIVIDPAGPSSSVTTIPESTSPERPTVARLRQNAPRSIVLPSFTFPAPTAPNTPYTPTPRFNPMESFLGKTPSGLITPGSSTIAPLTPTSEGSCGPETTPRAVSNSIMDRGRPISPPEFRDSFPLRAFQPMSPRSISTITHSPHSSSEHHHAFSEQSHGEIDDQRPPSPKQVSGLKLGVVRKAVPQLSNDEMFRAIDNEVQMRQRHGQGQGNLTLSPRNFERRGGVELFAHGDDSVPRPPFVHRRTASGIASTSRHEFEYQKPVVRRQATLPVHMDESQAYNRLANMPRAVPQHHDSHSQLQSPRRDGTPGLHKKTSVTFSPEVAAIARPTVNRSISSSSFTRFFHSKSKSPAQVPSPSTKPLRPSLRPVSMEGSSSSGSDRTLVEVRDLLRKMGSPRSSPKQRATEGSW